MSNRFSRVAALALTVSFYGGPLIAGPNDILIGLDQKVTYGPEGAVNGAPGKDEVLVLDVTKPDKPVIRARLTMANSLLGPPTNFANHAGREIGPGRELGRAHTR